MLNYNEIKNIAESKKILISEISEAVGMTSTGFKRSIEMASFPIGKVETLCNTLEITITAFFGKDVVEPVASSIQVQDYGAMVESLVSHIAWLQEEIDRLRGQQAGKKQHSA